MTSVDILILGAGWTSTFLIPLCEQSGITFAATTRSGALNTIKFEFQPNSDDQAPYRALPDAKTVLITFPITIPGASQRLVKAYLATRSSSNATAFIQLGTTGIWDKPVVPTENLNVLSTIIDRHSPISQTGRSNAEVELLSLSGSVAQTIVLNLAGLWAIRYLSLQYSALNYLQGSLHLLHGEDLARAILAVHHDFSKAAGQRWLLTDERVYDWWDLASAWRAASSPPDDAPATWVRELMREEGVPVLPRDSAYLGRVLDSREFWETFGLAPVKARGAYQRAEKKSV
ncbi:hypothetical protein HMN09_01326800 [Mycena chlorophos]|uniref:Uncharacterized protein n=1 Tax=Mycena chlorophos TaxID=658473 RepID=A0A8H6VVC6_MYCCL|nr:hypothetical protein HMN09_01326800 [Mycena chlorophos]